MRPLSIYIHIPFCIKKCLYCDFLSAPAGQQLQSAYMDALRQEIERESKSYVNHCVKTIFVGGGTPSILPGEEIKKLFHILRSNYILAQDCEITIEVNPGTVTKEKLKTYRQAGINRLSLGLQSANDQELRDLGRIHNYETFLQTYEAVVKTGFNNINIDLMSAVPGQTVASYCETLRRITALEPAPTHISAYSLIIEEGTPFYTQTPELPDEDSEREMYKITNDFLFTRGYHRYEISNYAKEGYECRHNTVYWQRGEYVGFGIGAASLIDNCRYSNIRDIESYINCVTQKKEIKEEKQKLSIEEQMEEFMFLGLRMVKGVSPAQFADCFGQTIDWIYPGIIDEFCKQGLLIKQGSGKETRVALTDWGMDVSNQVMAAFLLS